MADWAKVAGENHGLTIELGKGDYKSPWFLSSLKNALVFAVGYILIVGPFIAIGTAIAMEAIINPDELMDEVREQIPSVELTEGLIHEFKKITGLGHDAVDDVDKRSTTDSADAKHSIAIKQAKDDEVSTKPADGSKLVLEEVKKESDDKVIDVPAYKALSQAEFDATVKQMAYTVVKQSFGDKVNRGFDDYKHANVTGEELINPSAFPSTPLRSTEMRTLTSFELVEGENVKHFLKGFRGHRNPFHSYEEEDPYGLPPANGLKIPKQDEQEQERWEPIMKRYLMRQAASGANKLPDDDYNFGKEYAGKLKVKYSDI